ncbi:MAG TPA: amidohydrolase family protein [Thermoanaerobaculia bacterium]|jgi:imidazolonepropionase-like amidohydrolase
MKNAIRALALLLLATSLTAQPKTVVLKADRLFDGTSNEIIRNATIVITGNKIAGINVAAPAGAEVIDLGDATLLPGFIDCHVHLTGQAGDNYYLDFFNGVMRQPTEQAHYAAMYARRTIDAGFTTVRNVGADDYIDVGLRNAINAGIVVGPRMLVAVHAISATGGHADKDPFPPNVAPQAGPIDGVCNGPDECRAAVRYQIKYGADVIKFMPSGGVLSLADPVDAPEFSQGEMNAIVEEAHHWGRKVAAHCHGDVAAKMAIAAGVDSIEHGSFLKPDTLALMKEKGVYLVPTLMAGETVGAKADKFPPAIAVKARAAHDAMFGMFRNAVNAGVKIALGTDSAVSPHGLNAHEFGLMVANGMTPAAALRAGTQSAATLLGMIDRVGTIENGKLADIVAVPGNPLADIRTTEHVSFVMKDGVVVKRVGAGS